MKLKIGLVRANYLMIKNTTQVPNLDKVRFKFELLTICTIDP